MGQAWDTGGLLKFMQEDFDMCQLRFLNTYDKHGNDTGEALQYWNEDLREWVDVPSVRCRFDDEAAINEPPRPGF